ncbi:MAG: cytochrome c oxidase subunit 3 [Candidatus Planktophila sp.]
MSTETHAHHEHPDVVGSRNRLGVILILVADIAFALSILFVYFYLRQQNVNGMWLPSASEESPAVLPISSRGSWELTAIAAFGLLCHYYALKGVRAKNQTQLKLGSLVAFIASAIALVLQFNQIANAPFTFNSGAYASCYYLIAILNFVHLALTVFISFGNWNRSRLGLYVKDHWHVDIVNVWWVWMTVSSLLGAFALSFS